jgi:hypothetical protein
MKTFKNFINEKGIGWYEFDYKPKELNRALLEEYDKLYPLSKDKTFSLEETLQIMNELNSSTNEDEFLTNRQQLAYITYKLNIL